MQVTFHPFIVYEDVALMQVGQLQEKGAVSPTRWRHKVMRDSPQQCSDRQPLVSIVLVSDRIRLMKQIMIM